MTTPPTPAGWYPDPDGSGGQRYWDGSGWTEHRSPAAPPAPTAESAPAAESAGSDEPTAIVELPTVRTDSHRRPDDAGSSTTEPVTQRVVLPPPPPTHGAPLPPPPAGPPPSFGAPPPPAPNNRKLVTGYLAACAALLVVLILAIVYGVFIHDTDEIDLNASGTETSQSETSSEPTTTAGNGWGSPSDTESTTADAPPPVEGAVVDGPLSFTLADVERGTTVSSTEAPVEKTAVGEFVVVRLSVVNTSDAPAQFLGTFQKLFAGGTPYSVDDEATFYVGGGFVEIPPGAEAQVGLAYDVPPGTTPEFVELHADPMSPGVQIPLS